MKTILSVFLFGLFLISTVSAQTSINTGKPSLTINLVTPPSQQSGSLNYLLSLSAEDLKNNKYVFYTDSNATVAYLTINGTNLRLTGGLNGEHIMAYTGNGYTVTLSADKKSPVTSGDADDMSAATIQASLVIYSKDGQVIPKRVTGKQINRVKN